MEWWENQDLQKEDGFFQSIPVTVADQKASFTWTRHSGIIITLNLSNINLYNKFEDVSHPENDNDVILNNKPPNVGHEHLRSVIDRYCREPIPDHYFLVMQPYHNRYTKAKKIICNKSQRQSQGSLRCPDTFYNGQIYSYRTVNDRCTFNKATHLNQDTNDFFCTQNSALLNELFRESISEKVVSVSGGECQRNRRFCEECIRQSCSLTLKDIEIRSGQNCCHITSQCLLLPSCIDYYSPSCYNRDVEEQQHNLCMKGSTYKFTLNPQFSLNNSFLCHIKRSTDDHIYSIQLTVSIPHWLKVSFSLSENVTTTKSQSDPSNPGHFTYRSSKINIDHQFTMSSLPRNSILKYQNGIYTLHKLKTKFRRSKPSIEKHINLKYAKIQVLEPFAINSKNWMKKSCFINISELLPYQSLYDEHLPSFVRVAKTEKKLKSHFEYLLKTIGDHEKIEVSVKGRTSILQSIVCDKLLSDPNRRSNLADVTVRFFQKYIGNWTWNLEIKGTSDHNFQYYNIQLKEISHLKTVFNKDILVIKLPVTERNVFSLNHSLRFFPESSSDLRKLKFELLISDCQNSRLYNMHLLPKFNESMLYNSTFGPILHRSSLEGLLTMSNVSAIVPRLFLLFVILVSLLSLAILGYTTYRIIFLQCSPVTKTKLKHFRLRLRSEKNKKCLIAIYITVRIFYTFVFTSTCIVSLILTINLKGIIQQKQDTIGNDYTTDKIVTLYPSNILDFRKKCEIISETELRKMLYELDESLNSTISAWYISSESLVAIGVGLYGSHASNVTERIVSYFHRKIIENIGQRLSDRTGLLVTVFEEVSGLKWLQIIGNWSRQQKRFLENVQPKFGLFPILSVRNAQKFIRLKLNTTFENLLRKVKVMQHFLDQSFHSIPPHRSSSKHYRIFFTKTSRDQSIEVPYRKRVNHTLFVINDDNLSFIRIRIGLFVLDLLIIFSRCYNIYKDFQSIWFGSDKLLSFKYLTIMSDLRRHRNVNKFATDRKTAIATYQSRSANVFLISSLGKIRIFKCNYYIVLIIMSAMALLILYIFIVCQSSGFTLWIKSILNVHLKNAPVDVVGNINRRILHIFTGHQHKKKRQYVDAAFRISAINKKVIIARLNHYQNYQQNLHTIGLCNILRILSSSQDNNKMKLKMQSHFLFIPLQIVDQCLQQNKNPRTLLHIQQETCTMPNSTFAVNFKRLFYDQNQKRSEILHLFKIRDLILLALVITLITIVSMNLFKLILYNKRLILSDQISSLHIINSRPPSIVDNIPRVDSSTCLWPRLSRQGDESQDPYFTVSCVRLPKTFPQCRGVDNRETDI